MKSYLYKGHKSFYYSGNALTNLGKYHDAIILYDCGLETS